MRALRPAQGRRRTPPRGLAAVVAAVIASALSLAVLCAPGAALAVDQWSRPARGLRLLHRHVRHADGTPLDLFAVFADLCDPGIHLRATAPDEAGHTASAWARSVGATVAVNGDYFEGTHMRPLGPARGRGQWWPEGPHEHRDALFLADGLGRVTVLDAPDGNAPVLWDDAATRVGNEWTEVVGVRERVVLHGEARLSPRIAHDDDRRHPRTALGLSRDGHTLILLVINGRSENSSGATASELATVLIDLGAWEGMKLDGGGSSTLYVSGRGVLNDPSDGHERHTANQLGICVENGAPPGPRTSCGGVVAERANSEPETPPALSRLVRADPTPRGGPSLFPRTIAATNEPRPARSALAARPIRAALLAPRRPRVARNPAREPAPRRDVRRLRSRRERFSPARGFQRWPRSSARRATLRVRAGARPS